MGAVALLVACGVGADEPEPGVARPESEAARSPSDSGAELTARFPLRDYTYTLRRECFCADGGIPVVVTVRRGEVVQAEYARTGPGHTAGAPAERWNRMTIDDIIRAANRAESRGAYVVDVEWPDGQDFPASVTIDQDADLHDEEVTYTVSNVLPA